MKRVASALVFVIAVLALHQATLAQEDVSAIRSVTIPQPGQPQDPNGPGSRSTAELLSARLALLKMTAKRTGDAKLPDGAFNGYVQHRLRPDPGAPGSAGQGFSHFPLPMDRYTNWYRPKAATLTMFQRCEPAPFRPRGYGNLFADPADGFRMDYQPYLLSDGMSSYGPAYPARMPDPRCKCHDCDGDDCDECDNCDCDRCRLLRHR